mmetsp:Transcript_1094/g.2824  ORF Transcript_1094/g.2824 Transcript_1094/m.2824 type:complete len:161 (+) Transcript_1094:136-618(+)
MALSMAALQRALPGERREALLVGINAYNSSPLRNCVNDATDVATSLRRLGFRTLIETDCSLDVFENAIAIFQEWLKPGTVVVYTSRATAASTRTATISSHVTGHAARSTRRSDAGPSTRRRSSTACGRAAVASTSSVSTRAARTRDWRDRPKTSQMASRP